MQEVFLGEVIRRRRQDLKLTQEQLSEGICEQATISRFENGTQTPSRNRIKALLQRLGLPDDRFYALLSKNEEQVMTLSDEISACGIRFERANDEDRFKIRAQTLEKIVELEHVMEPDDQITRQLIMSTQATVGRPDGPYDTNEKMCILINAIRLTVPRFDLKDIGRFRYSVEEIHIINKMALVYSHSGEKRKSIDIYRQLLEYIEENNQKMSRYAGQLCLVAHNYAIQLGKAKRYEESIEIAKKGWYTCVEYGHYQCLPGFLAILAECYYFCGNRDESASFYTQAYYLYQSITDKHNCEVIRKEMRGHLNLELPY